MAMVSKHRIRAKQEASGISCFRGLEWQRGGYDIVCPLPVPLTLPVEEQVSAV
jgi:hypothetical protein